MKKLIIVLLPILIIVCACSIKVEKDNKGTDYNRFSKEYDISQDNPFKYAKINDILDIYEDGTGIIYFANSDDEVSIKFTGIIYKTFNDNDIKTVYYYNPITIMNNNTKYYQKVLEYSNIYEQHDNLIIPSIYFVKDGKIISYYHLDDKCKIDCLLKKGNQSKIKKDIKLLIDEYQSA